MTDEPALPPLPDPIRQVVYNESKGYAFSAYTADQMRAYALAALAQPAVSGKPFRPDWSLLEATQASLREHMAEIQRLRAALAQPAASGEPDMRHPKIQALIGGKARREIELRLVEQLLDDPDCDLSAMDMEYWHGLHDKLREKLTAAPAQPAPAPECDSPKLCAVNGACAGQYGTKKQCATAQPAPARVPLTDEQINQITAEQWGAGLGAPYAAYRAYARAIEAAHGITPAKEAP